MLMALDSLRQRLVGFHYDEELVSRIMFEPLGIGGDIGGKYLALVIGIIAVVLIIFHTNRTLVHNDHSKSKRPPRNRGSSLRVHPRDLSQPTIR